TIYILAAILLAILFYYEWRIGIAGSFIYLISLFYSIRYEIRRREKIQNEIKMISTRVKMVGKEALSELPFGIVLYDEDYKIEWANSYMRQFDTDETELIGSHLNILSEE